jgi:hypothetical protein
MVSVGHFECHFVVYPKTMLSAQISGPLRRQGGECVGDESELSSAVGVEQYVGGGELSVTPART